MNTKARVALAAFITAYLITGCAGAPRAPEVSGAWARPGDTGMNSAVYFSLQNTAQEDILLEARGTVAEEIQLHETIIDSTGTASMAHQEQVQIGANQRLDFEPGGLHVMLIRLRRPLAPGDTFDLALLVSRTRRDPCPGCRGRPLAFSCSGS